MTMAGFYGLYTYKYPVKRFMNEFFKNCEKRLNYCQVIDKCWKKIPSEKKLFSSSHIKREQSITCDDATNDSTKDQK